MNRNLAIAVGATLFGAAFAVSTSAVTMPAAAHDYTVGQIKIEQPWARPSLGQAPNSAAYARFTNTGETSDRLIAASVSSDVARAVELHTHINDNGVMRMRKVEGGIEIGAGETVTFEPGGLHIMLIGLQRKVVIDERLPMTLTFEAAGEVVIEAAVQMSHDGSSRGSNDGTASRGSNDGTAKSTSKRGSHDGAAKRGSYSGDNAATN